MAAHARCAMLGVLGVWHAHAELQAYRWSANTLAWCEQRCTAAAVQHCTFTTCQIVTGTRASRPAEALGGRSPLHHACRLRRACLWRPRTAQVLHSTRLHCGISVVRWHRNLQICSSFRLSPTRFGRRNDAWTRLLVSPRTAAATRSFRGCLRCAIALV